MPNPKQDVKTEEKPADAAPPSDPSPADSLTTTQRRDATMGQIVAARTAMLEEDNVDVSGMGKEEPVSKEPAPEEKPAPEKEAPEEKAEEKAEEKKAEPEEKRAEEEDPVYEMQIHGETVKVPLSQLKENFSLEGAGRKLMTDAAQIYKDAKAYEASVYDRPTPGDIVAEEAKDPLDDFDFVEIAKKLQYGEEDEAAETLKGFVTKLRDIPVTAGEAPVNVAEIEQRVMNAVDMKQSLLRFDEEYEDILSDPVTSNIALQATQRGFAHAVQDSRTNGTPMPSYWDILNAAGSTTRTWLEGIKGKTASVTDSEESQPKPNEPAQPVVDISPDKTEAKRSSVTPPSQGAPRAPATGEDSTVISFDEGAEQKRRSADIAEIAKARGQHA